MTKESDILERLARLEIRDEQKQEDLGVLLDWKKSCEQAVIKWGFKLIIILGMGGIVGQFDQVKKLVLKWLFP